MAARVPYPKVRMIWVLRQSAQALVIIARSKSTVTGAGESQSCAHKLWQGFVAPTSLAARALASIAIVFWRLCVQRVLRSQKSVPLGGNFSINEMVMGCTNFAVTKGYAARLTRCRTAVFGTLFPLEY